MKSNNDSLLFKKWNVIRDTYTVVEFLGQGAFGQVFKTRHRFLGLQAMKIFYSGIFNEEESADLFNEAWVLSEITHPNVVRVFDANSLTVTQNNFYYITMEYVNGQSLDDFYLGKSIPLSTTLKLMCDICNGLSQAHSKKSPIIHRDVKPQNILIKIDGDSFTAKVSDFGLAQHVNPEFNLLNGAGTLPFMAPEGFWNQASPASDVFSVGIVFYLMMTKSFPFYIPENASTNTQANLESVLIQSRRTQARAPSTYNPEIDPEFDEIISKSLAFDIKNRYQNAMELGSAIRQACQTISVRKQEKQQAGQLLKAALELAEQYCNLPEAILKMETAFGKDASLIPQYGKLVDQWRTGIVM